MIVRRLADRCLLITQPDHAHLARRVMEHCLQLAARPRRGSILVATGEHDNAWAEEDAAPSVDPSTGEILDFIQAPAEVRRGVWPRTVARLAEDPWAAALVAHHAATVYVRFRGAAEWNSFFTEMEATRDALVGTCGLTREDLEADYPYVRLGDIISLTFCTAASEAQQFQEWAIQLEGNRLVVTPDLFGGREIGFEITARSLPQRRFPSNAALREALEGARPTTLAGAVGGPISASRSR
jgi:hypothetical protein